MKRQALLFDATEEYVNPAQPGTGERFRLRLRTGREPLDRVEYLRRGEAPKEMQQIPGEEDSIFAYYEVEDTAGEGPLYFCFRIQAGSECLFLNQTGPCDHPEPHFDFVICPGFDVPFWSKGAVMYQIFTDRFYSAAEHNDVISGEYDYLEKPVQHVENWSQEPAAFDVINFYGGDLDGIREKLDYLQSLRVEALYLNPVFVSPSNHKYDIADYLHVDTHFGGDEALERLCREIHARGMKILLDGVFNHCSDRHPWVKEHPEYFRKDETGQPELWWGNTTLRKLDYDRNPQLQEEIFAAAEKWLRPPYCVDGWRLDVAADLGHSEEFNHAFWKEFRRRVKAVNPEALILAEHYGDGRRWLLGEEWDSMMNYDGFMDPVSFFLTGMEKHSDLSSEMLQGDAARFSRSMREAKAAMPMPSYLSAMNQLDNHDHSRFLSRTNHKVGRVATLGSKAAEDGVNTSFLRQALTLQMTWQGSPTLYYGDEAGVCGFTDPDSRRTYPWGKEDRDLLAFTRNICALRAESKALRRGSLIWLTAEKRLLAYARTLGKEKYIVVIHAGQTEEDVRIPVWLAGMKDGDSLQSVMYSDCWDWSFVSAPVPVKEGNVFYRIKPNGAYILRVCEFEDF